MRKNFFGANKKRAFKTKFVFFINCVIVMQIKLKAVIFMFNEINMFIEFINNISWMPIYFLLFGLGIYFTFKTNFFQIRKFGFMLKKTFKNTATKKNLKTKGAFTPLQAIATSLASTIGTGNIVGVAVAITEGGPGAIFWMWFIAFFGMLIKYAEIVLALKFREKNKDGEWCGGPMYYIKNGLKNYKLAFIFAGAMIFSSFAGGNLIQVHSIASIVNDFVVLPEIQIAGGYCFSLTKIIVGLLLALIICLVVIGGMKSIGKITEKLVPFMSIFYILGVIFVLSANYKLIPGAFLNIFGEAFKLKSALAGGIGYGISRALHHGIARGTSSSEAGIGTSPIAQAASVLQNPVEQALYGILEVFVSSFVICTLTALVILTSGIYDKDIYSQALALGANGFKINNLSEGVVLSAKSFATVMGPNISKVFIMVCVSCFALSTVIGYSYYGVKSYEFMFKKKFIAIYKLIFIAVVAVGPLIETKIVWALSDIFNALMAIPNLIGLVLLSKVVLDETKKYFTDRNSLPEN